VLIDEAHHFRNPGQQGAGPDDEDRSRYYRLYDLLEPSVRPKTLFMLTATPINNRLSDFRHMTELFTRRDEAYFAGTLGVNNLRAHFNNMEKALRKRLGGDGFDIGENLGEVQDSLISDEIFGHLVVQRSRAYARESQIRESRTAAVFPDRKSPIVADYSIRQTYGRLLDLLEKAFERKDPLFTLPIYYHSLTTREMTRVSTPSSRTAKSRSWALSARGFSSGLRALWPRSNCPVID